MLFVWVEPRPRVPMVDLALFRSATFTGTNVVNMIVTLGTFGVFLYTSLFFQDVLGYSPASAGTALLPWIGTFLIVSPLTGKLTPSGYPPDGSSPGAWRRWVWDCSCSAAWTSTAPASTPYPASCWAAFGGALTVPLANFAISAVPIEKARVASGVFNTFRETGGSLGIAIIGAVFLAAQHHASVTGATSAQAFASGYSRGLAVAALLAVLGSGIAALTVGRRQRDEQTNASKSARAQQPAAIANPA